MKKCYVVECSSGQHEDYHWWIAGIFDDACTAEVLKIAIDKTVEITKNIPQPFDINQYLTDKQWEAYDKWNTENYQSEQFNSSKVVEYPFNKPK